MKKVVFILALAALMFAATAVETYASERLDVNPPPLLEQISVSNFQEQNAQNIATFDSNIVAVDCGTCQFFVIQNVTAEQILRSAPVPSDWAAYAPQNYAVASTDDYKTLATAERLPRLRYMVFSATRLRSFANAR